MTGRIAAFVLALLACGACHAQALDASRSRIDFDVHTRIGSSVRGRFPVFEGRVDALPDGRRQVRLRLSTRDLEVGESTRYTRLARGPQLFDAERHPVIEFVSEPFAPELVHHGGTLAGRLRMRGIERTERFELVPAACERPGHDCPILATGRVSRDDYGLDGWRWALADRVRFLLNVRFAD
ncbi:MAG TPA: YceI family protein [Lysobacter sp.]